MKTAGNILRVETALLNVRHQCRKKTSTPSTIRKGEQPIPSSISSSMSSSNASTPSLALTSFGSMSSLRPSPKSSSKRSSGHSNPMGLRSTIHSSVDINSYARRNSSSMRRMSSENFVWNSDTQGNDASPGSNMNKPFGKTLRGRNSLTSSLFDRRRRNSSSRSLLKESLSTDSFGGLNNIEEMKVSNHDALPMQSSRSRHRLGSALSRLSSDSMSSFVSFSGDSVATDMSASNFTLGELKPRKLGMSKRNAFFPSLSSKNLSSSKALFTIDIDEGANFDKEHNKDKRNAVFNDGCIENEDLSSDSSEELGMREPKHQVEVLTT